METASLQRGLLSGAVYSPIHLQPIYKSRFGFKGGEYKNSEKLAKECLSLPMHVLLSDDQVSYVCEIIEGFFSKR